MRRSWSILPLTGVLMSTAVAPAVGPGDDGPHVLEVGQMAPDFELDGATRYGVLKDPVKLSDYRGKTVVLAFFFRVRTRG